MSRRMWEADPVICLGCGGHRVQVAMWVNTHTGEVDWKEPVHELYTDPASSGLTAAWCQDCDQTEGDGDKGVTLLSRLVEAFAFLLAVV